MFDFFKKINPFSNKKISEKSNDDGIKLYLDRKKKNFIPIKIKPESTCQEIHSNYHSEILSDISQLYSANNFNNLSVNQFSKNFNSKDYYFIIIDDENRFIELKMKDIDCPLKYMVKPTINIYYLNIGKELRKDSFDNELNSYSINTVGKSRKQNESGGKSSMDQSQSNIIDNSDESIREGDLMKFSNKKKIFEKRKVIIDKKKLIIEKKSKNDATILFLRDIKQISKDTLHPEIDSREKFIFEITTMEGEKYIFKSKNNADLVSWLETIENLVNIIRDNELILYFEENIKKEIKDINDKGKQILIDCLSLRGILSIFETRQIFFKFYDNQIISNIVEIIINYKLSVKIYKYKEALILFKKFVELLDIENLDINQFHNQLHFDSLINERKRNDQNLKEKNSSNNKKKYSINDIKTRNIIFDSKSNIFNGEAITISQETESYQSNDLKIQSLSDENLLSGKNISEFNISQKSCKLNFFDGRNLKEYFSMNLNNELSKNEFHCKTEKDEIVKNPNNNEKLNLENENNLILNKDEKNKGLMEILKYILTIDIITSLKMLKNEIKEYFEKYYIDIFGETNEFDFSNIPVQEQNIKFNEYLKFSIFNDIYENILSKYLNDFYKSIFSEKNFISSLEKILVHYFKMNNNLKNNDSKIIDFNDIIEIYSKQQ